jgi:hypothetical protein
MSLDLFAAIFFSGFSVAALMSNAFGPASLPVIAASCLLSAAYTCSVLL